jgi:hypothetical protein
MKSSAHSLLPSKMAGSAPISLSVGWVPLATGCWAMGGGPPAGSPPTGGPPPGSPPPGGPPAAGMGNVLLITVFIRLVKELGVPDPLGPTGGGVTGVGGCCAGVVGVVPIAVAVMVAILAIVND